MNFIIFIIFVIIMIRMRVSCFYHSHRLSAPAWVADHGGPTPRAPCHRFHLERHLGPEEAVGKVRRHQVPHARRCWVMRRPVEGLRWSHLKGEMWGSTARTSWSPLTVQKASGLASHPAMDQPSSAFLILGPYVAFSISVPQITLEPTSLNIKLPSLHVGITCLK